MSVLTLELPVELLLTLEAPPTPTLQPATWLPAAVEALQAFRRPA